MNSLLVYTDDICPSYVEKYWKWWNLLKANHPKLKLNAFVIPNRDYLEAELISDRIFCGWLETVKDWVSFYLHGYAHDRPPENLRSADEQKHLIDKGKKLLEQTINIPILGYKAPGLLLNSYTRDVLKELDFTFICHKDRIDILNDCKIRTDIPPPRMISTHTNGKSSDSVEKIYAYLNEVFENREFYSIKELIVK